MAGEIIVSSTTDTQEAVNEAAARGGASVVRPEPEEAKPGAAARKGDTDAEQEPAEDEPESTEQPEEEEEPGEKEDEEPIGKTKRKLMRKVSTLQGRNYALQEQLDQVQRRVRELEKGDKPAPAEQAAPSGRPDPKDPRFKTYEDYVEALADWKVEQKEQQKAQQSQQQYVRSLMEDYGRQVESARERYDDFEEVVNTSDPLPIIAINAMYEMSNGADVAYYLAKHPDVREELLEWNQPNTRGGIRKILATLDKISDQLGGHKAEPSNGNGSPKSKPVRSAPAPIKPVGGSTATRSTVSPDDMPYQDYKKWWEQNHGRARR